MTTSVNASYVHQTIETHLLSLQQPRWIEVAFYGGSFTALPIAMQQQLLAPAYQAYQAGRIDGIRISTRPDAISEPIARLLLDYKVSTVEIGVQSLDDDVLAAANRGHTVEDVQCTMNILTSYPFQVGIQIMPGLPQEDWNSLLLTAGRAVKLKPNFARIYPTVVINQTELAHSYRQGLYQPLSLDEAVKKVAFLKLHFEQNDIPVIRTGLQATEELDKGNTVISGPYHPAFGELVDGYIFYQMLLRSFEDIAYYPHVTLICHPRDQSKIRGQANRYWHALAQRTKRHIKLVTTGIRLGEVVIEQQGLRYSINRKMIFSN